MICRFLLFLILSAIVLPVRAQVLRGYGIKAGLTSSNVRIPEIGRGGDNPFRFETKSRLGPTALAFVEWLNLPALSFVTEAGYVQRGFLTEHEGRDAQNNPIGTIRNVTRFDYLTFAGQAKVRWPISAVQPYAIGGPRLDVLLGGDPDEEGTIVSHYSSIAFGGTFGVGLEAPERLPLMLFVELRYNVDLTNSLPDVPRDSYNNAFDLLVGVRL